LSTDPAIMMKNLFLVILTSMLILFGNISCRKEEKVSKPRVELISPTENSLIYIPDTIQIRFRVESEQAIESVRISIVNSSYISILGTNTINAPQEEEIATNMVLRSMQNLDGAPFYIMVAVNDGVNKWNTYFNIQLANKSLDYRGFYLFKRPGIHQIQIDFYDLFLNDTSFIQCEGEYLDSDISSFYKKLFLITETPAKLKTFSINENKLEWETEPQFPNPRFTDIQVNEDQIYAGMESGLIVGYSILNGQQKLVTEILTDSVPQRICILENLIVGDYLSRMSGNKTIVTFYKETGIKKHKRPINFQIVSFLCTEEPDMVLIIGNEESKGKICLYNARNNFFEYSHQIDEGEIIAVCEIAEGAILLIIGNSIYLHNSKQNITTELVTFDDAPEGLYYEYNSKQIIIQFEKRLSFYQYPGINEIYSLYKEKTLKGLQFYYQHD